MPFRGVTLCSTNISSTEEKQIIQVAEALGAKYSKPLDANIVTHLVMRKVGSPKHEVIIITTLVVYSLNFLLNIQFAIAEKIPCLTVKWIFDCFQRKVLLPIEEYAVLPFTGCEFL
jgi:hypothetical protein